MLEYWLWLTGRRGVGLRGLRALLEQFGTPEAVYCAAAGALHLLTRNLRLHVRFCSSATARTSMF